jgi:hypothetical protein
MKDKTDRVLTILFFIVLAIIALIILILTFRDMGIWALVIIVGFFFLALGGSQ